MPNVVILAGPNGAGKTSSAPTILRDNLRVSEFVNADAIARGLSGFSGDAVAVEAGRVMLRRLEELIASRQDFAFETTLSGNSFLRAIHRWRSLGYTIHVVYLWLDTAQTAIDRVHERVNRGGHVIPDEVVRRRYERGLTNFIHQYRNAADWWQVIDNTNVFDRRPVARSENTIIHVIDAERWGRLLKSAGAPQIREVLVADRPRPDDDHIARWFADPSNLERAMRVVHARVVRRHQLMNQPLIVSRDGQVIALDPHTVQIPDDITEEQIGCVFDYF